MTKKFSMSSMMTESSVTSPTSTTPSSTDFGSAGTKMTDKHSYRKSNKPMMERKRRARINHCLGQLKSLVLQAMKKDNSQYSKLEKADILELTVKHLKQVQRIQTQSTSQIPEALTKYRAGFNECANEVMRYLGESQGVNNDAKTRILSHLSTILTPVNSLPMQQQPPAHAHAPILPAPTPLHHQLQSHHQQQQQQQVLKSHQLLQQQQQEALQHYKLQTELVHANQQQQHLQVFPVARSEPSPQVMIDYNNNTINNNNNNTETVNRNYSTAVHANTISGLSIASVSPAKQSSGRNLNQADIKQIVSEANIPLQALSITSPTAPLRLPCLTTPTTAIPTAPFQLVQSTLPNGQVALVLAPQQSIPAMSVPSTHHHLPSKIAEEELDNQHMLSRQRQEIALSQSPRHQQQRVISPASRLHGNQDSSNLNVSNMNKKSKLPRNDVDMEVDTESRLQQPSAFRHPNSVVSSTSSSSSSSSSPTSSSSSFVNTQSSYSSSPSHMNNEHSVIKVARSSNSKHHRVSQPANVLLLPPHTHTHPDRQSVSPHTHDARLQESPATTATLVVKEEEGEGEVVRGPEDVTSVRELFEYKMGKRRNEAAAAAATGVHTNNINNTNRPVSVSPKSAWRPW